VDWVQQTAARKIIGVACVFLIIGTTIAFLTIRVLHTDVDASLASVRENYTCANCGNIFMMSIADAATMRRTRGDIICPKCGRPGAAKEAAASAQLVNDELPPGEAGQDEDKDESGNPRPRKPTAPSTHLTPTPKPGN